MRTRSGFWMGLAVIGMQMMGSGVLAGEKETGILTDRLSAKQLKTWNSIVEVVDAKGQDGQPLHPRLQGLWKRIACGKHAVYIEFLVTTNIPSYAAGSFRLNRCDPEGRRCEGVIRLCLSTIEEAPMPKLHRPAEEFFRFRGLGKVERYAEVLGHEMEHAVRVFEDPRYASAAAELEKQAGEFSLFLRQKAGGKFHGQEKEERIARLRLLSDEVEGPATVTESEIWRELRQVRSAGSGVAK